LGLNIGIYSNPNGRLCVQGRLTLVIPAGNHSADQGGHHRLLVRLLFIGAYSVKHSFEDGIICIAPATIESPTTDMIEQYI
jgi:hypothetical protein